MTTFQDEQPLSRRALRQKERTGETGPHTVVDGEDSAAPAAPGPQEPVSTADLIADFAPPFSPERASAAVESLAAEQTDRTMPVERSLTRRELRALREAEAEASKNARERSFFTPTAPEAPAAAEPVAPQPLAPEPLAAPHATPTDQDSPAQDSPLQESPLQGRSAFTSLFGPPPVASEQVDKPAPVFPTFSTFATPVAPAEPEFEDAVEEVVVDAVVIDAVTVEEIEAVAPVEVPQPETSADPLAALLAGHNGDPEDDEPVEEHAEALFGASPIFEPKPASSYGAWPVSDEQGSTAEQAISDEQPEAASTEGEPTVVDEILSAADGDSEAELEELDAEPVVAPSLFTSLTPGDSPEEAADEVQETATGLTTDGAAEWVPPHGHWSVQAEIDDVTQPGSVSRNLGIGHTATNALVLPSIPDVNDISGALTQTGEVRLTGSIQIPHSLSTRNPQQGVDDAKIDALLDLSDEFVGTDSAPIRAVNAVSTHTSNHGIVTAPKQKSGRVLTVLLISACVLAVSVAGLLIAAFAANSF